MRLKINRILLLIFMLGTFYSCSAQRDTCEKSCIVLKDIYSKEGYLKGKTKVNKRILTKSGIKSNKYFRFSNYLELDTLNNIYLNTPTYGLQVDMKNAPQSLCSVFTEKDMEYMRKQYECSDNISLECIPNYLRDSDVFFEEYKSYYDTVSIPLFSLDGEKCMFLVYGNINAQYQPNVWICERKNDKWTLRARIDGNLFDVTPALFKEDLKLCE